MIQLPKRIRITALTAMAAILVATLLLFVSPAQADNQRAVTIHDGEKSLTVTTKAETVGDVLQRADIRLGEHDSVEPSVETPLLAPAYTVNVYRARPVTIVDDSQKTRVMSSERSARTIVTTAGIELHDEDIVTTERITDFVAQGGPGLMVEIDRSVPMTLVLYGKQTKIRTQAETVGGLLKEKKITLESKDGTSKPLDTPIRKGMALTVYRDGVQTETVDELVPFETKFIQDADRKVGYREVEQAGQNGKRTVTYEVTKKSGKVIKRKKIASVVTKQPKQRIVVVGVKTGFSGTFAEALAKLRSCEGSYSSINSAGPYYGAYQFNQNTWNAYAPPSYVNVAPVAPEVPPAVQDQTARELYEARGWQPWPVCGADLPDIYR